MKAISAIFGAAVLFLVAAVLWYRWDSATNRGYKRGYWGQFNTVSNELSALPGVIIVKPWYNADLTLEEFGFDLLTQGERVTLAFGEKDPIRRLSGQQLRKALLEQIAKQISNHAGSGNGAITPWLRVVQSPRAVPEQIR